MSHKFRIEECAGNKRGSYFFEVFAPDGQSFEGERHSMIAFGATRTEGRKLALAEATATKLCECPSDCECREES